MPPLLVADALCKRYVAGFGRCWARVQVLASLSLTLRRGERVAIIGGRGAGKTTLLHCLTGLRRPDAGSVRWDASRGAPYTLCADLAALHAAPRHRALLMELPEDSWTSGACLEALHGRHAAGAGWLVLATRPGPLPSLADRVLELHEGHLRDVVVRHPRRVAEGW